MLGNTAAALLGARRTLNPSDLERAISLLAHARRIEFMAWVTREFVAQDAQHKFFRFGISYCGVFGYTHSIDGGGGVESQDVLVVIPIRGRLLKFWTR